MSKIKNDGLDQYGAEPFEQQQSGTAGVEGVNQSRSLYAAARRCSAISLAILLVNAGGDTETKTWLKIASGLGGY